MFNVRTLLSKLAVLTVFAAVSLAAHAEGVLQSTLSPCPAGGAGTNIGDVNACGLSWTLDSGRAQLTSDGKIQVKVKGLLINDPTRPDLVGTTAGVTKVYATLICGANGNRAAVASTGLSSLSSAGDALIQGKVTLPADCVAPAIVVRESDFPAQGWLAVTGF